jgi:hypothetical protein
VRARQGASKSQSLDTVCDAIRPSTNTAPLASRTPTPRRLVPVSAFQNPPSDANTPNHGVNIQPSCRSAARIPSRP